MTTLRHYIEAALRDLEGEWGGSGAGIFELHRAIEILDASREMTDKQTIEYTPLNMPGTKGFRVVNHKARVVWDD